MVFETLCSLFQHAVSTHNKPQALLAKRGHHFQPISTQEFERQVRLFSLGLTSLNVEKGSTVGLLSENRPEWTIADFGILCAGGITVPIYGTLPAEQIRYILADSGVACLVVSNEAQLAKVRTVRDRLPSLTSIILMDAAPSSEGVLSFSDILLRGEEIEKEDPGLFRRRIDAVQPSDVASIIYTSGTTGDPKGVMLMHTNIVSNVNATWDLYDITPDDTALSFLPLSHILERMVDYLLVAKGVTMAYAESTEKVPENLLEVKPTILVSVPRLYEKMYARVMDLVQSSPAIRRKLFFWAVDVGRRHSSHSLRHEKPSMALSLEKSIADHLVFRKIRARTGGCIKFCVSGGAPLSREIGEFFYAAGIRIQEGYGLTETSPVISANTFDDMRFGTVGKVIPGLEVKIAADGEILCKGPSIMKGYYRRDAETHEVIRDGWLHTGDIGHFDSDGYLVITDRKKDLIKTSGGKYVAPQPIENILRTHEMISTAVVIGNRRKFCSALIVPNFEKIEAWAKARGIAFGRRDELLVNPELLDYLVSEIHRLTPHLAQFEKIKKVALLPRAFTIEDDEITPSLKVRRSVIDRKYKDVIDAMYGDE